MQKIINLSQYPLDRPDGPEWGSLVSDCRHRLAHDGFVNLPNFMRADAVQEALSELAPLIETVSFAHVRKHNIYFASKVEGLPSDHPALARLRTSNRTVCADQMGRAVVIRLYEYAPLIVFLAAVMEKTRLWTMDDQLARVNVMAYGDGEALNWHFDRSEFTTTLLLQASGSGGAFEYARDLRSDTDPNHVGVARLLEEQEPTTLMPLEAGTLNIFRGKNTAHRVTPVEGDTARIIAVFSYYERPHVRFSAGERVGFYGRAS